jgi:hypothetical protein
MEAQRRLIGVLVPSWENGETLNQTVMVISPVGNASVVGIAKQVIHAIRAERIACDHFRK